MSAVLTEERLGDVIDFDSDDILSNEVTVLGNMSASRPETLEITAACSWDSVNSSTCTWYCCCDSCITYGGTTAE